MKTLHAVSLSLALLTPVFLCSCADFWFDYHNQDNPPPDTPAFDPPPQNPEPASTVELTNDQLVSSATQSLILALTRKGLSGTGMYYSPQNSIYADRVLRSLISEAIVKNGSDYCLVVSGPNDDGFDIVVSKELNGDPVIHISKKRRQ